MNEATSDGSQRDWRGYRDFHSKIHDDTVASAEKILDIVRRALPSVDSAADLGCGVGTWLAVLRKTGTQDIRGFDGPWVDESLLQIPRDCFEQTDLNQPVQPKRRYDLAISLEVAEHLEPGSAETIAGSLVATSDFVLFSAAIPGQGGTGHLNEQYPDYWVRLFEAHGYHPHDLIRGRFWDDASIPRW